MAIDHTGQRFGRLLVLGKSSMRLSGRDTAWDCACDCGTNKTVRGYLLRTGQTKSCGCIGRERIGALRRTHGLRGTAEYRTWAMMRVRCHNERNPAYKWYGGRGIRICDRWSSFESFLADMGPRPSLKHSLDRIDSDGDYEPGNCRWADTKTQGRNRRGIKLSMRKAEEIRSLHANGVSCFELASRFGVDLSNIHYVLKHRSWSDNQMLEREQQDRNQTIRAEMRMAR
jgi:hypothetical protein